MSALTDALRSRLDALSLAFSRLTQREQVVVLGGGAVTGLMILIIIGALVSSAITRAEGRVKSKTGKLTQILELQGEYKAKERGQQDLKRQLSRSKVKLVKLVEDAARQAGINKEIGRMQPQKGEPNAEGVYETTVDLTAANLSIDRLQDFLERLEKSPGVVIIDKLKVNKPYRKDTLSIEMTVITYKVES